MSRYLGPKHKFCRREGIPLCGLPNCPVLRRMSGPGVHGARRRPLSPFGERLREKQKARRIYGVAERQFRRYFEKAHASKEKTGEVLLQILERRLDNVVYRLGVARTRPSARQLVSHGHVRVRGKKVTTPSYQVDEGDTISFAKNLKAQGEVVVPGWLAFDPKKMEGKVLKLPVRQEMPAEVSEHLIVEYYAR